MKLDARIPSGPLAEKWSRLRNDLKLVSPANKRKHSVIVVGTGLAGGAAAVRARKPPEGPRSAVFRRLLRFSPLTPDHP